MITFVNESMRQAFHQLPVDLQLELTRLGEHMTQLGFVLEVFEVDGLEVVIRINK